ncbi:MAG: SDR family oxidoreductase [Chitinophagaceae bacterium]|nr:SDR family oxidoreductase [Chitinophagaceae bacterium]
MDTRSHYCNPEIWGGIECTINRVSDSYFDQLEYSGSYQRTDDIQLLAGLGIKALRFPILWERHQPDRDRDIDWAWTETRLLEMHTNHIRPIAGLIHHGSGPSFTSLINDRFADDLQSYALRVATKFPSIQFYTPVNEPLTTARFSGLYGLWYPHHTSDKGFATILLNQLKAIVLCMRAIRTVNPTAQLIQTEDLGKTYSTRLLNYQAIFENHRRWLTFDFLCGKVVPGHPLWPYFIDIGITEDELLFFYHNPCPPDIMGFNHYITSERFLDHNYQKYPEHTHGGNKTHRYADVEAIRVEHGGACGLETLLREAWNRFKLPMAVTEVHLHCTREEQLRWFKEKYETCCALAREDIPIKAITAWSLFGAFGWNKLLTQPKGDYEPGVFSVVSGNPRPTALAKYIKSLTTPGANAHPVSMDKGWWHRDIRLLHENEFAEKTPLFSKGSAAPVLIIGKNGTLGKAFGRICEDRGIRYRLLSRQDLNICHEDDIEQAMNFYKPWAIVNAAGYVHVDEAETEIQKCFADNTKGPELLAKACKKHGIKLLTFSSDLVFDGTKTYAYVESDQPMPLNIYGKSKAESEKRVLIADSSSLIIRSSAFFGPWDQHNFVNHVVNSLQQFQALPVMKDVHISPTYIPDLIHTALDLLIDDEKEIWHIANNGEITWADMAHEIARMRGYNQGLLRPRSPGLMNLKAARPLYSVLKSEKGIILPTLENALSRYFDARCDLVAAEAV